MEMKEMSSLSWQNNLHQTILKLKSAEIDPRIALIGVGNPMRGDDVAGILLTRLLRPLANANDKLLVACAGTAPENCIGLIRRFNPDLVLFIDAAQLNEKPGAVRWIPWRMTTGFSASTHTLPIYLLASYLNREMGCQIALLGIQPAHLSFGPLTPIVRKRVWEMAQALRAIFASLWTTSSEDRCPRLADDRHPHIQNPFYHNLPRGKETYELKNIP
jgi:hydrogenase 3 maturation protease